MHQRKKHWSSGGTISSVEWTEPSKFHDLHCKIHFLRIFAASNRVLMSADVLLSSSTFDNSTSRVDFSDMSCDWFLRTGLLNSISKSVSSASIKDFNVFLFINTFSDTPFANDTCRYLYSAWAIDITVPLSSASFQTWYEVQFAGIVCHTLLCRYVIIDFLGISNHIVDIPSVACSVIAFIIWMSISRD